MANLMRYLLLLSCCYCSCYCHVTTGSKYYIDPMNESSVYHLANLIFASRPKPGLKRMYPNLIPFADMLHPVKRSYQFGFPEFLRSGVSSEVPTEIVFYTKHKGGTGSSGGRKHAMTDFSVFAFVLWMNARRSSDIDADPVKVTFKDLINPKFNLKTDLLDRLGDEKRTDDKADIDKEYLYRDQLREFLVGTWQSMYEDSIFHDEENVWNSTHHSCRSYHDVFCLWRMYLLVLISSQIKITEVSGSKLRMPTIDKELRNSADTMAVSFWFSYCRNLNDHPNRFPIEVAQYCPNPCRNNPCADMAYTMTDSCEVYNGGLFELDFKCTCLETAFWSFSRRACIIYDRCKMNSPCSISGTESCDFNPMSNELKCHCKAGFMGYNCKEPRNACYVRQVTKYGSKPTGNRACNVETGSECIPELGSNLFSCRCLNGWLADPSWGSHIQSSARCQSGMENKAECGLDPNCQRRRDPCMLLPCETGDCVAGIDEAMCQCPATHVGKNCRQRRGLWSHWGPWSSCDPDCGERRVRHRIRACLGLDCLGHEFESAWCIGTVDCGVPEKLGIYPTNRWRTAIVLRHMLILLAIGASMCMGVLMACQCCLSLVLKCDRGLLNYNVQERVHTDQLLTYWRLSNKTALKLGK